MTNTTNTAHNLRAAAQAVINRWDAPSWKDEPATAHVINALRAALAAPARAVAGQDLTDAQIMASVGRVETSMSESRPLGQQWGQVCNLVRAVIRERCASQVGYSHADVTTAHTEGYKLGLAQRDVAPAAPAQAGAPKALPLAITSAPERIWLDLGFSPYEEDAHFSDLHDLTWSNDNPTGDGIEYVRADRAARGAAQAAPVQGVDEAVIAILHDVRSYGNAREEHADTKASAWIGRIKMRLDSAFAAQAAPVDAAVLRDAECLVDVIDDHDNKAPEHRCYVSGAYEDALDDLRASVKAARAAQGGA